MKGKQLQSQETLTKDIYKNLMLQFNYKGYAAEAKAESS